MSVKEQITNKLVSKFQPKFIEVENESYKHSVPEGSESHFKVLVVSKDFSGLNRVERQRLVYALLAEELNTQIHALSLRLLTVTEFDQQNSNFTTPDCSGSS